MAEKISNKIIGIDLGTTNSVVSIMENGETKVLINAHGSKLTPSIVGFTDKGERLIGELAKRQMITNPNNTVYSIKRFMGRRHREVGEEEKMVPYKVVGGSDELVKVDIRGKLNTPPEISAMVLQDLKRTAEDYLGEKVERAVITVPAYFNDSQRQATKEAGQIAGLKVERIINEPTAAALAYGFEKKKNEKIAVFDFGGGTFDVSILDIGDNVFEVLSTNGDTHLGGDNIDHLLMDHIADEFQKKEGIDLRKDPMALQRMKEAAEKAKCELSQVLEASINLPFITADQHGPKHLQMTISRAKFEQLCGPIFERFKGPCLRALEDSKLKAKDIDEIVLVGGATRTPKVQAIVKEIFGKDPNKSINPDEVVSIGAAIQGAILGGEKEDIVLLDVTPLSLGVETLGGVMTALISRNTTIPTSKKETFSTAADNQTEVEIHILQGERQFAQDNRTLGRFKLAGIAPAPRGMPQIEVTFDIDANGILNVSAKDMATAKEQKIEIRGTSGLTEQEIHKMTEDATKHEAEDKKRREVIDARNQADHLLYTTEKTLKEHGDKIGPQERGNIESAMNSLREVSKGDDADAIKRSMENLMTASQEIGKKIYEKVAQQPPTDAPGGEGQAPPAGEQKKGKGGDDVIDAEYEVK
ncbi:MAG: molecular chaperone DnaK [Phycisphaerae bacterium]